MADVRGKLMRYKLMYEESKPDLAYLKRNFKELPQQFFE